MATYHHLTSSPHSHALSAATVLLHQRLYFESFVLRTRAVKTKVMILSVPVLIVQPFTLRPCVAVYAMAKTKLPRAMIQNSTGRYQGMIKSSSTQIAQPIGGRIPFRSISIFL